MIIRDLFKKEITRPINGVIKADQRDPESIWQELDDFTHLLVTALKTVYDPEIPVDIYELGLIYKVDVSDSKDVVVDMTLTAPNCPVAGEMPDNVKAALHKVEGIGDVTVNMTFDFVAPARVGDWVEGRAEVVRQTRSLLFSNIYLTVGEAKILRASSGEAISRPARRAQPAISSISWPFEVTFSPLAR